MTLDMTQLASANVATGRLSVLRGDIYLTLFRCSHRTQLKSLGRFHVKQHEAPDSRIQTPGVGFISSELRP